MRISSPDLEQGARRVITRNLGLRPGEDVVILQDEATTRVGRVLAVAASLCAVRPTLITVLQKEQPGFADPNNTPAPLARAIDSAQAVVISLSDIPDGTGFRRRLLSMSRQMKTKVALMPGVTLSMIAALSQADYDQLAYYSEVLHAPFLLGRKVVITTRNRNGDPCELRFDLGSWDQPPTISSGIIRAQSFDNIPSGEVYIAPIKGTADGRIVINGSVTDYVFPDGDELQLVFEHGILRDAIPHEHTAARFIQEAIALARSKGDIEPDFLCELGIGIDGGITHLTGNTLQDEKMLGTAHIAIGLNEPFGGHVEAHHIHEDMIFRQPSISIDGKQVMRNGKLEIDTADWLPSYRDVQLSTPYTHKTLVVQASGAEAETRNGGALYRMYYDGTDAPASIQVGSGETALLAAKVYGHLPEADRGKIKVDRLSKATGIEEVQLRSILFIMGQVYRLCKIVG